MALGFVEITRKGSAGNAGYRQPTLYRLTYRHSGSDKRVTDDWRRLGTIEEAVDDDDRSLGHLFKVTSALKRSVDGLYALHHGKDEKEESAAA